ncbi:Urb2/Npa2 family-domain-containing protein [Cerioporus squamosus]|nr:Urb2/Npa2 family-domain-containing protein [Cerioporus squamosus]
MPASQNGPQNAQDFIRALKAASDPPQPDGPLKIDIARLSWDNAQLYVPNKSEAIVDWLLSRLLKEKSRAWTENPICDSKYWHLLADILSPSNTSKTDDHVRAYRAWLVPVLARIPVAPIFLAYFDLLSTSESVDVAQCALVFRCISTLWPLAMPKFNPESLLECFGAVVQLSVPSDASEASCGKLQVLHDFRALSLIVSSYRASLAHSAAKKKLYTIFLKRYLPSWLHLASCKPTSPGQLPSLVAEIYDAGIETMFGLDIIRQAADHKLDTNLSEALEAASKEHSEVVLRCLPRIFESYVQTVKRHKGALFSQGSNQASGYLTEQVQRASMAFYAACDALARSGADDVSWQCRTSLLDVVERENLLSMKDEEAKALLRGDGDLAIEALAAARDEQRAARTECAVKILATLTRIDYDLMSTSFAAVFPRLAAVNGTVDSAVQFLKLVLEYDSKTRNLLATIAHASEAFSVQNLQCIPGEPQVAYEHLSSGPLTSLPFLDDLSRVVHGFLTPGQVLETIRAVSRTLRDAYTGYLEREAKVAADRGDGPRKKRKKDAVSADDQSELGYFAVSFALTARVLVVVLRSLPMHTVTDDVRVEAERLIAEAYSAAALRPLTDELRDAERRDSWCWQVVIAGALRLHYALARAPKLSLPVTLDEDVSQALLSSLSSKSTVPELVVEVLRTLLHQCSIGAFLPEAVLDRLLQYLEANLSNNAIPWNGKAHTLRSHADGGVAVLHVLVDQWLPYFDTWATLKQLERLATVLVNVDFARADGSLIPGLTVRTILTRMLHDAQFWELLRIRDVFLARLQEHTAPPEGIDFDKLMRELVDEHLPPVLEVAPQLLSAFELLALAPPEYIPRQMHVEFLERGCAADVAVALALRGDTDGPLHPRHLVVIRETLRRTIGHFGALDNNAQEAYVKYLISDFSMAQESTDIMSVTMDLVGIYQGLLVKAARKGDATAILDLIHRYQQAYEQKGSHVTIRASLLLVDVIAQTSSTDFSEECVAALRALRERMLSSSLPLLSPDAIARHESLDSTLLDVWAHVVVLSKWLHIQGDDVPRIGRQLSSRLLSWKADEQQLRALAPVALSILFSELQDDPEHVDIVLVAYLSLSRICGRTGTANLESRLASASRTMPVDIYASLLDVVYDALPLNKGLSEEDVARLIRFSTIVVRDAPEGTSRICQTHITRCLNLFADDERFVASPVLRGDVLESLVKQCSDRPASLRIVDLSSLWSMMRALLAGSYEHEQSTDASVFHGVVNVLSALVRLRRDLVLNTLPHLGFILRQLLGAKQSRIVMDTLPRWIAPTQPLSGQESKALARLLTTLTTKTMPESLVRPFSKHAAYVLTAYIEAVNDPLCSVSSAVRKELQPGLFALCDMLGEHNRDAMMVAALDAGGKATMKVLWKEYEKQRYVGKG